jgi:glucoamylase
MFANINVPGAANGTVIASQSREDPNYAYNWVRDAALTMDTVSEFYAAATTPSAKAYYETILFQYAQARAGEQTDPDLMTGLGEPKFNLNNTLFTGPWGRPQVSSTKSWKGVSD